MFRNGRRIRHKFNSVRVKNNGNNFASKLEEAYDAYLQILQKEEKIEFYLWQVPLRLPGGTKYIVDFVVFDSDGTVRFVDVKGMETDVFKIKKREIEAHYPFDIVIIKKGDF